MPKRDIHNLKKKLILSQKFDLFMPAEDIRWGEVDGEQFQIKITERTLPDGVAPPAPEIIKTIAWDEKFYVRWEVKQGDPTFDFYVRDSGDDVLQLKGYEDTETDVDFLGLSNGIQYDLTVEAEIAGIQVESAVENVTLFDTTITGLSINVMDSDVVVSWDGNPDVTSWEVVLKNADTGAIVDAQEASQGATAKTLSGVEQGKNYTVELTAYSKEKHFSTGPETVSFSTEDVVFVADRDGFHVYSVEDGDLKHTISATEYGVNGMDIDPIRDKLVTTRDNEVILWSIEADWSLTQDWTSPATISSVVSHPRFDYEGNIYIADQDSGGTDSVKKLDPTDGSLVWEWSDTDGDARTSDGIGIHPLGIIVAEEDFGVTYILSFEDGSVLKSYNCPGDTLSGASTDNYYDPACDKFGQIYTWLHGNPNASSDRIIVHYTDGKSFDVDKTILDNIGDSGHSAGKVSEDRLWSDRDGEINKTPAVYRTSDHSIVYTVDASAMELTKEGELIYRNSDDDIEKRDRDGNILWTNSNVGFIDNILAAPASKAFPWIDTAADLSIERVTHDAGANEITVEAWSSNPTIEYSLWQDGVNVSGWQKSRTFSGYSELNHVIKVRDRVQTTPVTLDKESPDAPTGVVTDSKTDTTITVSWDENTESDLAGYNVYVDGSKDNSSLIPDATGYQIDGLRENTDYQIVVTAVDDKGNEGDESATHTETTNNVPPSQPTGLVVEEGDQELFCHWDDNTEHDLAGYNLYVDGVQDNTSLITVSEYTVTGLNNDQQYLIEVEAEDTEGATSTKASETGTPTATGNTHSLSFDGVDDFLDFGDNPEHYFAAGQSFTIEWWVKLNSNSSQGAMIVKGHNGPEDSTNILPWYLSRTNPSLNGHAGWFLRDSNSNDYSLEGTTVIYDEWHHVAGVYDAENAEIRLYVDGLLEDSMTGVAEDSYGNNGVNLMAGPHADDYGQFKMDELRIWKEARTGYDIRRSLNKILTPGNHPNLTGYYKTDDETDTTLATDESGNNNDATINGAVYDVDHAFDGRGEFSLEFDGVDDNIDVGSTLLEGEEKITIECWVRSQEEDFQGIIRKENESGGDSIFYLRLSDTNNLRAYFKDEEGDNLQDTGTLTVYPHRWNHIAAVIDGANGSLKTYINGQLDLDVSNSSWGVLGNSSKPALIGEAFNPFNGNIDEFRVWTEARTQAQLINNRFRILDPANEANLEAYWRFEDDSDQTAYDETGNYNGTINGAVYSDLVPIVEENSIDLDGTDDWVLLQDTPELTGDFTLEAWVYKENTSQGYLLDKGNTGSDPSEGHEWRGMGDGTIRLSSNNRGSVDSDGTIPLNQWVHVAVTFDSSTGEVNFYFDGVLDSTKTLNETFGVSGQPWKIGRRAWANDVNHEGMIDELRMWSTVRTQTEINDNKASILDPNNHASLEGYYRLSHSGGSKVYDQTSNNRHGTLQNEASFSSNVPF